MGFCRRGVLSYAEFCGSGVCHKRGFVVIGLCRRVLLYCGSVIGGLLWDGVLSRGVLSRLWSIWSCSSISNAAKQ